jgi:hypothetical protein
MQIYLQAMRYHRHFLSPHASHFGNEGVESFGEGTEVLTKRNPPPQRGNGEKGIPYHYYRSSAIFFCTSARNFDSLISKNFRLATPSPHDEVFATVVLLAHYGDTGATQLLSSFPLLGERCFAEQTELPHTRSESEYLRTPLRECRALGIQQPGAIGARSKSIH